MTEHHDQDQGGGGEEWEAYLLLRDEHPTACVIDQSFEPDPELPMCVRLSTQIREPGPEGLPQDGEEEALDDFEDALLEAFSGLGTFMFVARVTREGRRTWYGYAPSDRGVTDVCRILAARFPQYPLGSTSIRDPEGEQYAELLPTAEEALWNHDAQVIMALQGAGDPCTAERAFDHEAAFETLEDAKRFAAAIEELGFAFEGIDEGDEETTVRFTHRGVPDLDQVFPKSLAAAQAAEEFGGIYDGWGCKVMGTAE